MGELDLTEQEFRRLCFERKEPVGIRAERIVKQFFQSGFLTIVLIRGEFTNRTGVFATSVPLGRIGVQEVSIGSLHFEVSSALRRNGQERQNLRTDHSNRGGCFNQGLVNVGTNRCATRNKTHIILFFLLFVVVV